MFTQTLTSSLVRRSRTVTLFCLAVALFCTLFPHAAQAGGIVSPTCGLALHNFAAPVIGANLLANANPTVVKSANKAVCVAVNPGGKTFQARLRYTQAGVTHYTPWTNVKGSVGSAILLNSKSIPVGTTLTLQVKHTNVGWFLLISGKISH